MRYSKAKIIFTTIASILCLFAIVFLIIVGINYSKNLTENGTDTSPKLVASVSNRKAEEAKKAKEESKKTNTKKEVKKTETKTTKKETKKEEVKEDVSEEQLEYTYDVSDEEYDPSINGRYRVQSLKVGNKEYSAKEIRELEESGTSMSLIINKYGIADVAVLDLKKMYEVTDEYFDDGIEQIRYSKNIGRIRIKIDDKEILFEKE